LNGAVFDGLTADFSEYTDVKVNGYSLANKPYVDAKFEAVPAGPTGATGLQGPVGPAGAAGAAGPAGIAGPEGPAGIAGPAGANGADGAAGPEGPVGPAGPEGPAGANGADGAAGAPGADGAAGAPGADGAAGAPGANGADGAAGAPGADGAAGMNGMNGIDGADGAPGPMGPAGASGADILGVENTFTANNYFTETTTFSKQIVLPESLTRAFITNTDELNIECAHASSGIFSFNQEYNSSPTIINSLKILNPRIGGQYVVYINNNSQNSFSINGRTTWPSLSVTVTIYSSSDSYSSYSGVGRMNYPGAVTITGYTELSSAILSVTWDGTNAFVACSAYGTSNNSAGQS
jgi:hypothetical protein